MKFTSLLSIVMLLASSEAVQLEPRGTYELQTTSLAQAEEEVQKWKFNKAAVKERLAQAKAFAKKEAAKAKKLAAEAKTAYQSGDLAGVADIAKGGL